MGWDYRLFAVAARTDGQGADARGTERAEQPGPRDKCAVIPFDFGEMEFRPLFRILAPPGDAVVIFEHQVVAAMTFLCKRAVCRHIRLPMFFGIPFGIFEEETGDGDFLAIVEHQHQVVAATLITGHFFRSKLEIDY